MEKKNSVRSFITAFFVIGIIVCFFAVLFNNVILAAITFTVLMVTGIVYSSITGKKNKEWCESRMKEFLDSFTYLQDEVFSRAQIEKAAPLLKEKDYSRFNGWKFEFRGRTFLSEDVSFGTEKTEKEFSGDDYRVRFDPVSRARAIKADTGRTYPLIKFRCNNMRGGGSDEEIIVRLSDEEINGRYTVSSDTELTAGLIEMFDGIIPVLKKASEYGISFSLYENTLFSYRAIEASGYFCTYVESDPDAALAHIRELREQLEVTKEMSDVL